MIFSTLLYVLNYLIYETRDIQASGKNKVEFKHQGITKLKNQMLINWL